MQRTHRRKQPLTAYKKSNSGSILKINFYTQIVGMVDICSLVGDALMDGKTVVIVKWLARFATVGMRMSINSS